MGKRPHPRLLIALTALLWPWYAGCDGDVQSVHLVAQDYRFTPDTIHLASSRPVHLTLFNGGREFHEFESRLLADPSVVIESAAIGGQPTPPSRLRLGPGQRLTLKLRVPAGTYLFSCKVRGHAGMTGTFIVQ